MPATPRFVTFENEFVPGLPVPGRGRKVLVKVGKRGVAGMGFAGCMAGTPTETWIYIYYATDPYSPYYGSLGPGSLGCE